MERTVIDREKNKESQPGDPILLSRNHGACAEDNNNIFPEISDQNYKLIIEISPVPIFIHQKGRFVYANLEAARLHGFESAEELIGNLLSDFVHPDDLSRFEQKVIEDQGSQKWGKRFTELRIIRNKNEVLDLEVNSMPMIFSGKEARLCICIDRTDHNRSDSAIQNNLNFLQTLIDTIPSPIFYKGTDYAYLGCNRVFSKLIFGLLPEDIIGKTVFDFPEKISESQAKTFYFYDRKLFREPGVQVYETQVRCSDDEPRDFVFYKATFNNTKGNVAGIVGVMMDITELRKAERELYNYQQKLLNMSSIMALTEEEDRRRIATELHERIGQILAISKMKLGIIKKALPSTGLTEALNEINDLIGQTIQETRALTFQLSPPVLHEVGLVEALDWLVETLDGQSNINIRFKKGNEPVVLDERVRVLLFKATRELLLNLVAHSNAKNATVCLSEERESIRIQVQDDGIGFDISKIDRPSNPDSGFGLFSIRERMNHLNGSIHLDSDPGRGARITLISPLTYQQDSGVDKKA